MIRACLLAVLCTGLLAAPTLAGAEDAAAAKPTARTVAFHAYTHAITLQDGDRRVVLCPQAGGRVLEFSAGGRNAMWLDDEERNWKPGGKSSMSAGRFDFGPELTVPAHETIWSGEWTGEVTGDRSARLTSAVDTASGVQLRRDFTLQPASSKAARLTCTQTMTNVSRILREYCHWGRSFSPGGGICLIPLAGASRFPAKYAMYEEGTIINVKNVDDKIRERDGFLEILAPPRKPKLGFDSYAGWLAYVTPDNTLFVKRFATHPDRVYNEAAGLTISVWYPPGQRIELEPIGPRESLKPGESASFTEEWYLLSFPFPKSGENLDLQRLRELVEAETTPAK